jgi:hypothetical protein
MDTPAVSPLQFGTELSVPDAADVQQIADGVAGVLAGHGLLTALQRDVLAATFASMTGHQPSFSPERASAGSLFDAMTKRNQAFRQRIVQQLVLGALLVRPMPGDLVERVRTTSAALGIDEATIDLAAELAAGQYELAVIDFDRNGYNAGYSAERAAVYHASSAPTVPWQSVPEDAELASRWRSLESAPEGSLGLAVSRFYRARGFQYPGTIGSVSPQLAQHDWVHVVADYGATIDSELEVFAFIARANDDARGFSFLAMVVSLFETGVLSSGVGLFQPDAGHLQTRGMPERLADAMRRGALCNGSIDFLAVDWFELAQLPLDQVRRDFGIVTKSPSIVSPGPFAKGGMTTYQLNAGQAYAESRGVPYETWGASLP